MLELRQFDLSHPVRVRRLFESVSQGATGGHLLATFFPTPSRRKSKTHFLECYSSGVLRDVGITFYSILNDSVISSHPIRQYVVDTSRFDCARASTKE